MKKSQLILDPPVGVAVPCDPHPKISSRLRDCIITIHIKPPKVIFSGFLCMLQNFFMQTNIIRPYKKGWYYIFGNVNFHDDFL